MCDVRAARPRSGISKGAMGVVQGGLACRQTSNKSGGIRLPAVDVYSSTRPASVSTNSRKPRG